MTEKGDTKEDFASHQDPAAVFVDPILYSARAGRVQLEAFSAVLLVAAAAVWIKWAAGPGGDPRFPAMLTSIVFGGWGLGYYMMARNRGVMMEFARLEISESGFRSVTPAGEFSAGWDKVIEVQVCSRPSRGKSPDVRIKTEAGFVPAFMRWVDKSGPMPEPVLRSPGLKWRSSGGDEYVLGPHNSDLVRALEARLPAEKIIKGVLFT